MKRNIIIVFTIFVFVILVVGAGFLASVKPLAHNCEVVKGEQIKNNVSSRDSMVYWWDESYFSDKKHYKYANEILYVNTYEEYFAMLDEFYPLLQSNNSTEYDKYKASTIQFDSLISFPGDGGSTVELYLYAAYSKVFYRYNTFRAKDLLKASNCYSSEIDSAWNHYLRTMEEVVDTVVLYRPSCLGTISQMEAVAFFDHLDSDYLNSLLEFLHFRQIDAPHHAIITDEMIQCAFDSLRAHQYEPDAEYDDIIVCYPPVATRVDAINRDQAAWNDFINVRNAYEGKLNGAQKRAYRNATNNLKWSKLWLLKNEYRNMGLTGGYYEDLFLPFDCTDDELMEYNYYEKVILTGNHRY